MPNLNNSGKRRFQALPANLIGALVVLSSLICSSMSCKTCGDRIVKVVSDPTSIYRSVVFQRSCDATVAFITGVALLEGSSDPLTEPAIVFIAAANHSQ